MKHPLFPVDLVTFTEEILNGKVNFLCAVLCPRKDSTVLFHPYIKLV